MSTRRKKMIRPPAKSSSPPVLALDDPRLAFITNKWSRTIVQPLLISVLITGLLSAILVLAEIITGSDVWLAYSAFIFFVTLEGCYTTLWLQRPERRLLNHTSYRAAEALLLALLLRLFSWSVIGNWPDLADLPDILARPHLYLVDAPFIFSGILCLFAWERTNSLAHTFIQLAIDQAEVYYYSLAPNQRNTSDKPVRTNRGEIVLSFFRQWIIGALFLAIVTSLSNYDVVEVYQGTPLALARLGLRTELVLFLLLYFLAGFALLSQARLAAMNARWLINGVTRAGRVEQSWHRYTLLLLGGIALVAAFLPIGSTFAIGRILQVTFWAISVAVSFVLTLLTTLLAMLLSLFTGDPASEPVEPLPQPTMAPLPTATPIPSALPPRQLTPVSLSARCFGRWPLW
ncbi:MAG: hypothetical protein IPM53_13810 [Anaerolineaceae bacterium]|nr:hypothetical protein [Anaerolineaceae bacterium]